MKSTTTLQRQAGPGVLALAPIQVNDNYRREWQILSGDFQCLTKDGELLRNTLYRVGGIGTNQIAGKPYFMLLKHVEAEYSPEFMRDIKSSNSPKHLESRWVIIDQYGEEKVEFKKFDSPYLVKDSCLYSLDRSYYNIETGYCYGQTSNTPLVSKEFIFLDLGYGTEPTKRGVLRIHKQTGETKLFPA